MRLKVIKKLVDINILYSSQEANLANLRKKQAKNPGKKVNVSARVLSSYIFSSLLMLFMFINIAFRFPFEEIPSFFSSMVAILLVLAFSTSFTAFYNVFYESKDLVSYRPYAFKESEIIIAKGLSVLLPALPGIVPILAYFLVLYIRLAPSLWLGLPLMLLSLALLFVSVTLVMVVAVHFLAQTRFFRKYQSIFSNVMIGIGVLIPLIFVLFLQSTFGSIVDKVRDIPFLLYPLHIFYKIAVEPFSTEAILGLLAWIGLTLFLLYLTKKKVLPRFYDVILLNSEEKVKKERRNKERISTTNKKGFFRMVLRYHLTLLGQGTGVVTVLFTSAFLPYLMMIGLISNIRDSQIVPDIHPPYWLPLFFIALFIAVVNNNITSLHSIALSLERENVDFLKSLPFDFARYVKVKFWIIFAVQFFLPVLILLGLSLYLGLPILSMIYLLVVWTLASVILSCHNYFKDVKNLSTNWSSITDLVNRSNRIVAIVLLFIYIAILMALVIGSLFLVQSLSTILAISLGVGALIILLGLAIFSYHYYLSRILAEIEKR
ncbi:ABC transporter membrane protein [Streptococcus pneumoniae]|nr:ABC transporter membrane protein [Streptococcus pneumoniae]